MRIVEVWRDDDELLWRWAYRDSEGSGHRDGRGNGGGDGDGDAVEIRGNRGYPEQEQAVHAAGMAYPGVPMRVIEPEVPMARRTGTVRSLLGVAVVLLVLTGVGIVGVLVGLVVAAAAGWGKLRRAGAHLLAR